jgi:hypothetical protein
MIGMRDADCGWSALRRRSKVLLGVVTLLTSVALLAGYLYLRYVDVVRYSAEQGRVTLTGPAWASWAPYW